MFSQYKLYCHKSILTFICYKCYPIQCSCVSPHIVFISFLHHADDFFLLNFDGFTLVSNWKCVFSVCLREILNCGVSVVFICINANAQKTQPLVHMHMTAIEIQPFSRSVQHVQRVMNRSFTHVYLIQRSIIQMNMVNFNKIYTKVRFRHHFKHQDWLVGCLVSKDMYVICIN